MREHRVPLGHVSVTTLSHMYARACAACVTHQADSASQANTGGRLHPAVGEVQETQGTCIPQARPGHMSCPYMAVLQLVITMSLLSSLSLATYLNRS